MNFHDTAKMMREAYPSLYATYDDIITVLFFGNGSDFTWLNGELVHKMQIGITAEEHIRRERLYQRNHLIRMIEDDKSRIKNPKFDACFPKQLIDAYLTATVKLIESRGGELADIDAGVWDTEGRIKKEIESRNRLLSSSNEIFRIAEKARECWFKREDGTIGNVIDRISQNANIFRVPSDATADWVAAAKEAVQYALTKMRMPEPEADKLRNLTFAF